MILDSFENATRYFVLNPHFEKAFAWLDSTDLDTIECGRHEIDGDNIFCFVAEPQGRKPEDADLEAHRAYIDIQVCQKGVDNIAWKPLQDCLSIKDEYSEENDILFYHDSADAFTALRQGQFCIYFPEDAHAPVIADEQLKKIVVKVKVES